MHIISYVIIIRLLKNIRIRQLRKLSVVLVIITETTARLKNDVTLSEQIAFNVLCNSPEI